MRAIAYIVLHCSATQPDAKVEAIQRYWRESKGWKMPGYHYIIEHSGALHILATEDQITNGVAGHNQNSIHICYIGGIDKIGRPKDTRSTAQIARQIELLRVLKKKYPNATIQGHRDFPNVHKACPSFDVKAWLKTIQL